MSLVKVWMLLWRWPANWWSIESVLIHSVIHRVFVQILVNWWHRHLLGWWLLDGHDVWMRLRHAYRGLNRHSRNRTHIGWRYVDWSWVRLIQN